MASCSTFIDRNISGTLHSPPLDINKMQNWGKSVCKLTAFSLLNFTDFTPHSGPGSFSAQKEPNRKDEISLPSSSFTGNHQCNKLQGSLVIFTMPIPASQAKPNEKAFSSLHVEEFSLISPAAGIFFELQTKYSL